MKILLLLLTFSLSVSTFAESEEVDRPIKVEKCKGTLELRSFPVTSPQGFDKRYFLKFIHSGNCESMVVTVDKEMQLLNVKSGTVLLFSNQTMKAYLDNDGDNIVNINFFSNGAVLEKLPSYTIINDRLELNTSRTSN